MSENSIKTAKSTIYAYHGSPGTTADFYEVAALLPQYVLKAVSRQGYPQDSDGVADLPIAEKAIVIGYSWGAVRALERAAERPQNVAAVVVVAPFLQPRNNPSGLLRAVMGQKWLARLILGKVGPGAIQKFLVSSAAPHPVPASYAALAERLARPEVLARSQLEKDGEATANVEKHLQTIAKHQIPVTAIWGTEDESGGKDQHVNRIKRFVRSCRTIVVPGGGHALLWTHPQVVADAILAQNGNG